jgi:glycosyltransferase involved in cell wall biosynthesis
MCQNQLVFDTTERKRYGFSWSRLRIELLTFLQRKSFRSADGTIFLTEFSKQSAGQLSGKAQVIPHGINPIFIQNPTHQALTSCKILYPSSIDLYKYQWNVAEAVLNLKTKGFNITLELVGAVLNQKALQLLKPFLSSAPETIHYRGEVGFEEMQQYYQDSDIVVFASGCETFGMILLEAMAMGKPIACSNRSSLPETLGEAGVYFDPSEVTSIENVLELLLTNPALREKIADLAHQKALTYSWERCANQTFQFLADVYRCYKPKN